MSAVASSGSNIESTVGRIFLRNLDHSVNILCLFDAFSVFGEIVSCKVFADEEGRSRGYAFVQFETEESAQKAVLEENGIQIASKEVLVEKFKTRAELLRESSSSFTNVFVKNFGEELDDVKLKTIFEKYGETTSCVVMRDAYNKSKGFGFVAFKNSEDAKKAVAEIHGKTLEGSGRQLYVCRAQKKSERHDELKKQFDQQEAEEVQDSGEATLYVANINGSIDDDGLTKIFADFGNVTSVKILRCSNGRSRGKGFVSFEKADDAIRAVDALNSKIVEFKTLYVTFAQSKEDRLAQMAYQNVEHTTVEQKGFQLAEVPMFAPVQNGDFFKNASGHQNHTVFFPGGEFVMDMPQNGVSEMQGQQQSVHQFVPNNVGPMPQLGVVPYVPFPNNGYPQQSYPGAVVPSPLLSTSRFGYTLVSMQSEAVHQAPEVQFYPVPSNIMSEANIVNQQQYCHPPRPLQLNDAEGQKPTTSDMHVQEPEVQKQKVGERKYALAEKKDVSGSAAHQSKKYRQQA